MSYKENSSYDWTTDSIRHIHTPSATAKSSYFYVQEAGYFNTQPLYYTEREHLNSYLLVYTLSGKGYLRYKNKTYTLLPDQAFFIDCMEHQYYSTDKQDLWEILWIHMNGGTTRGYYEQYAKLGNPIATLPQGSSVPATIREIIDIGRNRDIRSELLCSKLLVHLLTDILMASNDLPESGYVVPAYVKAAMTDMEKRFDQKITLDELAEKYSVNKFHLAKEFKKYTGSTPNEYIINVRITFAKEWLKYSDMTIAEIALKAGIDNVSHFINLFKKRTDMTPLAFRKEWRLPSSRRE
ncbi:MAG: AraC family transcriptional regulator [Paenibacillaceae bacterium]